MRVGHYRCGHLRCGRASQDLTCCEGFRAIPACFIGDTGERHATRWGAAEEGGLTLTCDSFEVFVQGKLHRDVRDPEQARKEASKESPPALGPINSQGSV